MQKTGDDGEQKDLTAVLPDGTSFDFWEKECKYERTLYVACEDPKASDSNDGSEAAPFKTLNRAAAEALPGTKVLIKGGIYRECLTPQRGGSDSEHMISFEAFPGEQVIISASEQISEFSKSSGWKLLPVSEFSSGTRWRSITCWGRRITPTG